ncbi:DUF3857 domain-containing protein [Epilithonimonas caeni]|uniref:DUF3857 domain-containing protein n=1 Tax=Epilithonimonas caeni TaxID=365343 RepID=UPI0009FC14D1|nr:DUF3857 domain-containing protein [Epilithonimonas caeni]
MKKLITLFVVISVRMLSQNYGISEIPEELKKDANAVIRNISSEYVIKAENSIELKKKIIISILNKAGEGNSYVYIPYDKYSKISDIKIKVLDENGKQIKTYSKSDLNDVSQSDDSYLYSDDRALRMRIINPVYPYTIETSYTERSSDTVFLPVLQPYMDENVSVQNWSVEFKNESGIKLRKKVTETSFGKAEITESDNFLKAVYKNLPAYKDESYSPDQRVVVSKVEFALDRACLKGVCGDFSNWNSFANWYKGLLEPVSVVTPEIQQEVDALALTGTVSEKVQKIYQYMQSKTRYVFVAIGIGGWQPMSADDVRKKGYGDCKALTNYMRVLLKAAGIPSYYSVIYSDKTAKVFDKDFPKMDGNHVILCVPTEDGNIWLENTSQNIAFNHLSYRTMDRNVIMVKDSTAELIDTPKSLSENNKEILRIKANISADNTLSVSSNFNFSGGMYDMLLPLVSLSPTDQKDALKKRYDYLQFSNIDLTNLDNDRSGAKITFDLNFKANNYSKSLGADIYFRAIPFLDSDFHLENTDRKLPIEIPFGFTDDYEVEYTIPETYKFSEILSPVKIDSEFGSFSMEFIPVDKKLLVKRKFMLKKGTFSPDKISDYINFRKKTNKIDHTKILITKL